MNAPETPTTATPEAGAIEANITAVPEKAKEKAAIGGLDEDDGLFQDDPLKGHEVIRFVVSGCPIDIPSSMLLRWPDTMLMAMARTAINADKYDVDGKTPLVPIARDAKFFRIIRHFMETHELITPPQDSIDRQLLIAEASYYAFPAIVHELLTGHRKQVSSSDSSVSAVSAVLSGETREARELKRLEDEKPLAVGKGRFIPSLVTLKQDGNFKIDSIKEVAPPPTALAWTFWCPGCTNDIDDHDQTIRAQELLARIVFGKDEDGTNEMRKWTRPIFWKEHKAGGHPLAPIVGPDYPKLVFPKNSPTFAAELVSNWDEFQMQFRGISMGLLDGIINDLPVVVAGGSVLMALHKLPRRKVAKDINEQLATKMLGGGGKRHKHRPKTIEKCFAKVCSAAEWVETDHYWRGHSVREQTVEQMQAQIKALMKMVTMGGQAIVQEKKQPPKLPSDGEDFVSLAAWLSGVRWTKAGKMERAGIDAVAEEEKDDSDEEPQETVPVEEKKAASETKEEAAEGESDSESEEEEVAAAPTPILTHFGRRRGRLGRLGRAISGPIRRSPLPLSTVPVPASDVKDKDVAPPALDDRTTVGWTVVKILDETKTDSKSEAEPNDSTIETKTSDVPEMMENIGSIRAAADNTEIKAAPDTMETRDEKDAKSDEKKDTDERQVTTKEETKRMLKSFRGTDIDLFLVTRSVDEAYRTIVQIYKRIRRLVPKKFDIRIMRTDQSVTFLLPWPYRHIQIITRLYYSMEHVLLGFDVDCCCVGYDGRSVLALPRAFRALQTRTNLVDPTRQSTTYESRLFKYAKRGFSVAVPGLDIKSQMRAVIRKAGGAKRNQQYLTLSGVQLLLAMLYSMREDDKLLKSLLRVRVSDYGIVPSNVGYEVRQCARNNKKPAFAFGKSIVEVLQSNICQSEDSHGTPYSCFGTCSPVVSFQTVTPHQQDRLDLLYTGAFHPTSAEWYGKATD